EGLAVAADIAGGGRHAAARLGVTVGGQDSGRGEADAHGREGDDRHRGHARRFFRPDRSQQLHDRLDESDARRILGEGRLNPPGIDRRSATG
ncbi:hypothetical protein, partial [Salmonella sp. gx-h1]|uniref:hypothetical protein n=1 Tax=Salmonella sp. gx-h1 TaxID=2582609 RepID=UPI001372F450